MQRIRRVQPGAAPDLRNLLHEQHTVELRLQVVLREQIVQQGEVILILMAEAQIPGWILDLLVGQLVLAPVITATAIELENEILRFVPGEYKLDKAESANEEDQN